MKFLMIACIIAGAYAVTDDGKAAIKMNTFSTAKDGKSYNYAFETENGIKSETSAILKEVAKDEMGFQVQGANSYISPEGEKVSLTFTADENGYHPVGSHLPTPPTPMEIPRYILKAIEFIKTHPYDEKKQQ